MYYNFPQDFTNNKAIMVLNCHLIFLKFKMYCLISNELVFFIITIK